MTWQHIQIARFGGPEVLKLKEEAALPEPGRNEVRIRVSAAGTGFTDAFIRRGRYPDFKGPLPFTPGYDLVGTIDAVGPGIPEERRGEAVCIPLAYLTAYQMFPRQSRSGSSRSRPGTRCHPS